MDKDSILFANEGEERCVEIQKQLQYLQWRKNQVTTTELDDIYLVCSVSPNTCTPYDLLRWKER